MTYLSSDSTCKSLCNAIDVIHIPEFLNGITPSGLPTHKLTLKIGVPVILLRNIDQMNRLCNGTMLIVTQLENYVIEGKIISGNKIRDKVFLPRMNLTSSDQRLPFKLKQRQFPIHVCFAMTINKIQGQSLTHGGLYLPRPCVQLWTAICHIL